MELKVFQLLEFINTRLTNIEKNINRIEEKLDYSLAIQRNHLIRVKNGEDLDDAMILMGRPYNDLTPQQAYSIYQNGDLDFIVLDVSAKDFSPPTRARGHIHIPLDELPMRYTEIQSKTSPILVMSEDGLRSILACELLVKKGHFNVNNVSGGHKFWPENAKSKESMKSV